MLYILVPPSTPPSSSFLCTPSLPGQNPDKTPPVLAGKPSLDPDDCSPPPPPPTHAPAPLTDSG